MIGFLVRYDVPLLLLAFFVWLFFNWRENVRRERRAKRQIRRELMDHIEADRTDGILGSRTFGW